MTQPATQETLPPCPFCGEAGMKVTIGCSEITRCGGVPSCGAVPTSIWNRRAQPDGALREALVEIDNWIKAYPETIFRPVPPEKLKEAAAVLKEIGVDMGALHAGWARHLLDGIGKITRAALASEKDTDQ